MENLTIIIPIHEYNESVETYFKRALESVQGLQDVDGTTVSLVGPADVLAKAKAVYDEMKVGLACTTVENDKTDFANQVNCAVMQCVTKYFSVLELDDVYYPYWLSIAKDYLDKDSILLPIAELISTDEKILAYINEIVWSASFAEDLGHISQEDLKNYMDFQMTGGIFKTEDFISLGGLKPSMKFACWYEFIQRAVYNGKTVFVLPRVTYQHTINREGSNMVIVKNTVSQEEGQWLIQKAKEEFLFKEDRNPVFESKSEVTE